VRASSIHTFLFSLPIHCCTFVMPSRCLTHGLQSPRRQISTSTGEMSIRVFAIARQAVELQIHPYEGCQSAEYSATLEFSTVTALRNYTFSLHNNFYMILGLLTLSCRHCAGYTSAVLYHRPHFQYRVTIHPLGCSVSFLLWSA
jgi:hypothetical protein